MDDFKAWSNEALGTKAVAALEKNNFAAAYVKTKEEAIEKILAMIPANATVGVGGSWTINELDLSHTLEKKGHTVYDHNRPGLSPDEALRLRRQELTCGVFLTGTNAITLDGKLVNVDGSANRVAAMMFGPEQVIVIAGVNKIVRDTEEAERRIQTYAAPMNNKRLNRPNPCTTTGICMDCQGPTRICNVTTILRKRPSLTKMHIFIIGEQLGF
ncbi:lactate utilization protein [Acetonema longum]|uniref:LUD domain-containing protein n=1 Tax=Acetonema longum DSM 6540 TaxID=1009370 RepID=F7NEH6_9FIRM|nr:lactate utilization protein [Acetonema longum]EGO65387.1 hypothetical protein ALO_02196 [Acetonema longum DSM 6540]